MRKDSAPHKVFLFCPAMESLGAWNPACNVLVPEAGDARNHNIRVRHGTLFSFLRLRLQY
jgi:hypothetical protein